MKLVAVIVPIYKNSLNELEQISLKQIHKVLGNYDIFYIKPKSLVYSDDYNIKSICFDDSYFTSTQSYSKLLLNPDFYSEFLDYKYILICQLDVFIFSDRLKEFCEMGYDYYGAPWINGVPLNEGKGLRIRFAGNGGLSLRNVKKTIGILKDNYKYAISFKKNEDYFFSYFASKNYKVAPTDVSIQFCIETQVKRCMKINKGQLPFGTHAWERYDFEYWKELIETCGYNFNEITVKDGQEDVKNSKGLFRVGIANLLRKLNDIKYKRRL